MNNKSDNQSKLKEQINNKKKSEQLEKSYNEMYPEFKKKENNKKKKIIFEDNKNNKNNKMK